jgi:hypothetical protein
MAVGIGGAYFRRVFWSVPSDNLQEGAEAPWVVYTVAQGAVEGGDNGRPLPLHGVFVGTACEVVT